MWMRNEDGGLSVFEEVKDVENKYFLMCYFLWGCWDVQLYEDAESYYFGDVEDAEISLMFVLYMNVHTDYFYFLIWDKYVY